MSVIRISGSRLLLLGVPAAVGVLVLFIPTARIFDTSDFPARWYCGKWTLFHGCVHIVADIAIWGAYTAIPILIAFFVRQRTDVVFPRVFWLFAAFILVCGTVHLIEAIIFWSPVYRLSAVVKLATAVISWATVIALFPVLPEALAIPSRLNDIQSIIEHAPIAMLVTDYRGRILVINRQTEELFGYARDELIGEPVELIVPENVRSRHPPLVRSFFAHPKVTQLGEGRELRGTHKDGQEIPVEIGLTPLILNGQRAVLACIANQTMHKRRREKELTELSQALSLREVAGGLAHELNTPIQRIITWAGVLKIEHPSDELLEPVQRMMVAAQEMGQIVHRLRDAVIRRDRVDSQLDLNETVRDTLTFLHKEVAGIRTSLQPDLPTVVGDPIQLQLVLSNLIRNAYQAGGPVTVTTLATSNEVTCRVDDCGEGFTVEPKTLFESFYTTKSDGLGMGLTITQAIIRRYGGRITAFRLEPGARLEFTLPARSETGKTPSRPDDTG